MRWSDHRSRIGDRLLSACVAFLVGAVAVYVAIRLVEAVWLVLLIIVVIGLLVVTALNWLRNRNRGW